LPLENSVILLFFRSKFINFIQIRVMKFLDLFNNIRKEKFQSEKILFSMNINNISNNLKYLLIFYKKIIAEFHKYNNH